MKNQSRSVRSFLKTVAVWGVCTLLGTVILTMVTGLGFAAIATTPGGEQALAQSVATSQQQGPLILFFFMIVAALLILLSRLIPLGNRSDSRSS